jgi:hypothetical protein
VLPVQHALQGHPETGALWEKFVSGAFTKVSPRAIACSSVARSMIWQSDASIPTP